MVKTNVPSSIQIGTSSFETNALPDPFDERDLQYRPKLQPLLPTIDQRAGQVILDQKGQSCTGHAVAALIDTVLSEALPQAPASGTPRVTTTLVSPYMLYALARKYDEFPGDADVGSSLRGALKGWYHHGVCAADRWTHDGPAPDLGDPGFIAECMQTPLGAYQRVNSRRLDDMQSAVSELNAIVASAAIHDGWRKPKRERSGGQYVWVIRPGRNAVGGHAFLIAGYNDVGFLVQNSWGSDWGRHGYATLPYEDWLDNAYDAWVARPGVPQASALAARRVNVPSGSTFVVGTGMDLVRLKSYVIDVGAGGKMDNRGKAQSDPAQIASMAQKLATDIEDWAKLANGGHKRRLVMYAHGGLVGEDLGISIADRMIDWWRANHIYPVHIVWESDALTTIMSSVRTEQAGLPWDGILDGAWEALDGLLERSARKIQSLWAQMKLNALMASWPRGGEVDADAPGVTLFIGHLKAYRKLQPDLEIHLVAHSAGSVVMGGVVDRLAAEKIPVESIQLMGGAISVEQFMSLIGKHLPGVPNSDGMVKRVTAFDLKDGNELDDVCPGPPSPAIYHKSLLYLVARALEPAAWEFEKPMVGLSKSVGTAAPGAPGKTLLDVIGGAANLVVAPNDANPATRLDSRSGARGHGDFDNDVLTMTSVVLRILGKNTLSGVHAYPRNGMPSG